MTNNIPRFSILSLLGLTLLIALATGWILDNRGKRREIYELKVRQRVLKLHQKDILIRRINELQPGGGRDVRTAEEIQKEISDLKRELRLLD